MNKIRMSWMLNGLGCFKAESRLRRTREVSNKLPGGRALLLDPFGARGKPQEPDSWPKV